MGAVVIACSAVSRAAVNESQFLGSAARLISPRMAW
jgi:hypothetical protein